MKQLVDGLHENGQHWIAITDAGVAADEGYAAYEDGEKESVFIKAATGDSYLGQVGSFALLGLFVPCLAWLFPPQKALVELCLLIGSSSQGVQAFCHVPPYYGSHYALSCSRCTTAHHCSATHRNQCNQCNQCKKHLHASPSSVLTCLSLTGVARKGRLP